MVNFNQIKRTCKSDPHNYEAGQSRIDCYVKLGMRNNSYFK